MCDPQVPFNNARHKVKQEDTFLLVVFLAEKSYGVGQINPCRSLLCISTQKGAFPP